MFANRSIAWVIVIGVTFACAGYLSAVEAVPTDAVTTTGTPTDGETVDGGSNAAKSSGKRAVWVPKAGFSGFFVSETNNDSSYGMGFTGDVKYRDDSDTTLHDFGVGLDVKAYGLFDEIAFSGRLRYQYENRDRSSVFGFMEQFVRNDYGGVYDDASSELNPNPDALSNTVKGWYLYEQRHWSVRPEAKVVFSQSDDYNQTEAGANVEYRYQRYWTMASIDYVIADDSNFPRFEWLFGMAQADIERRKELDYSFGIGFTLIMVEIGDETEMKGDLTAWGKLVWEIEKQKKQLVFDVRRKMGASSFSTYETTDTATIAFRYFFKTTMFADVGGSFKLSEVSEGDSNTRISAFAKYRVKPFRGKILRDLELNAFAEFVNASAAGDYTLIIAGAGVEYTF